MTIDVQFHIRQSFRLWWGCWHYRIRRLFHRGHGAECDWCYL